MHIYSEKEVLSEAIQAVLRVVSPRTTLPVLGGVRVTASRGKVSLAASDLEIFVVVEEPEITASEEGEVVIPGRLLGEIVRSLPPGRIEIKGEEGEVVITGGNSEFSVTGLGVSDFPASPEVVQVAGCKIDPATLADALRRVVRAASTDEGRPILTGVLWAVEGGSLRLAATDSYRLAMAEIVVKEGSDEARAIIPARALAEVTRLLPDAEGLATVVIGESQAKFEVGKGSVTTRLIEGEFPNYKQLIPEGHPNSLEVASEEFASAVERVGLVAQTNTPVKLHLADEVELTASEAGVAQATDRLEGASYEGEPMIIAFNPRFLKDGIEASSTEKTRVELGDAAKPAVIKGEGLEGFLYLLMPVRLPG